MDTMKRNSGETTMQMCPGQIERLRGVSGVRLICRRGTVWITQEGLVRDDFLSAGEFLVLVSSGLTLIESIGQAGASLAIEAVGSDGRVGETADQSPRALA
jgi:hypothetical protein